MILNNPYIAEYLQLFSSMQINGNKAGEIDAIAKKISAGKTRYHGVQQITGVPWFFIGVVHYLEANCDFSKHLHNGDPLSARTVQVPSGRPRTGQPPFTWEESALDALQSKGFHKIENWTIPTMLYLFESFNGFGYRGKRINSPYLWSYSNQYSKGKYVADGVYDPNKVSKQAGAAVILKRVMERHNLLTTVAVAGGIIEAAVLLLAFFF